MQTDHFCLFSISQGLAFKNHVINVEKTKPCDALKSTACCVLTAHKMYCRETKNQLIIKCKRYPLAAWYLIGFPTENT